MSTIGWALLCLASALLGFLLSVRRSRARRSEGAFAALHSVSMAAPALRGGLTSDSARVAAGHLRMLLGAGAVAIVTGDGEVVWEGAACSHVLQVPLHASSVLAAGTPQLPAVHGCDTSGCPLDAAVAVPLTVGGRVIGTLAAYDARAGAALVRAVAEIGRWASGQLELAELDASRRRAQDAETRALRAQISPHFVYNSLTTIASFVRTDPARARELLLDFADFARHGLRRAREFTTLADELGCVDRYLSLERARFGERLRFSVEVAPETLPVPVPFLCVQPLVENAVKHGLGGGKGTGEVRVVVEDAGPETHISVADDGTGMDPARLRDLLSSPDCGDHGIGLANVDIRLRRIYGEDYGLQVESKVGVGTTIRLRLPKVNALANS
ncbi:histidine kinase [Streptosporangium soli]|nr:histidine kinase [Streptosporangium sp. KLBMP 9127]